MGPCQSIVVQRLVWLYSPMREWQSTTHSAREVVGGGGGVATEWSCFCGERASPQLSGDVSRLPSQYFVSSSGSSRHDHSAYSQLFGSISRAERVARPS